MALEAKLVQKLSQSLLMTPQLQQAIKLLQLGRLEYKEAIERELLDNPVLEEAREGDERAGSEQSVADLPAFEGVPTENSAPLVEGNSDSGSSDVEIPSEQRTAGAVDWEDYVEGFSDWRGAATPRGTFDTDDRPSFESNHTKEETLEEHLIQQLRFLELSDELRVVALHIVGNLTREGYLCISHEALAAEAGCTPELASEAIALFKTLDPPGVGARDLKECLMWQLENIDLDQALEGKIISNHLDKLERRRYDLIAKEEDVTVEDVYKALTTIQTLEPRPARQFPDETARYVVPDVYVQKVGTEYVITLNEDGLPKLRVSPYYLEILKRNDAENAANKAYLNERLKAAAWLIKSIHQRQSTIYKVAESIMKFQRDFLEYGIQRMKPLVLKDVADDIGMHESTVSRVTTAKYIHTPQGVYELKFFFSTGLRSEDGSEVSASAIKEKIKNIIDGESASAPVSDQQIVEMLKSQNIEIARRTVAKYRESLGLESSSRRKKLF